MRPDPDHRQGGCFNPPWATGHSLSHLIPAAWVTGLQPEMITLPCRQDDITPGNLWRRP